MRVILAPMLRISFRTVAILTDEARTAPELHERTHGSDVSVPACAIVRAPAATVVISTGGAVPLSPGLLGKTRAHRSHFGSRYTSGCCGHASPFSKRGSNPRAAFLLPVVVEISWDSRFRGCQGFSHSGNPNLQDCPLLVFGRWSDALGYGYPQFLHSFCKNSGIPGIREFGCCAPADASGTHLAVSRRWMFGARNWDLRDLRGSGTPDLNSDPNRDSKIPRRGIS